MEENILLNVLKKNYDLAIENISLLRDGGGKVYIAECAGKKYLLKLAGTAFGDTVRQSADVMCYLAEKGFPVPAIIRTKAGKLMLETAENGCEQRIVMYEYIDGSEPNLWVDAEQIGELAGRLHDLLSVYEGRLVARNDAFFVQRYVDILRRKSYPKAEEYASIGEKAWQRVEKCEVGACHGDFHRGNLLKNAEGVIYVLDFDTVCEAPRMFDVMVMCYMTDYFHLRIEDMSVTEQVFHDFVTGYARFMNLSQADKETLKDWIVIRHFQLQATIVEMYGIDCIDGAFIDRQLEWLKSWMALTGTELGE